MTYQELVDKCKNAYKNHDLKNAYQYWCDIHNKLFNNLDKYDKYDDKNRNKCYEEFYKYEKQFTDQEVYDITDYGKEKCYKELGYLDWYK